MQSRLLISALGAGLAVLCAAPLTADCTSILVTRGASTDGSVIITYACDGEFHPHLRYIPAADHAPGEMIEYKDRAGQLRTRIPQVPHTYAVVGLMNEHQLAIGETTFGGREELYNPDGTLHYWELMKLALQRAKTAREAIGVMTQLVDKYGYRSPGESISIADKNEVWILEIIGRGPGQRGANWVAVRLPDGTISCHANKARIGTFPLDDPENCLYDKDVISFAIEKGYYDPAAGQPFRFCDVYCPPTPRNQRYASTRVWSVFRRAAPSLELSPDYHRAVPGAKPYPLWIKPDRKLSVADVMALMRDHYEGTPYDMTKGIDAGPFGMADRWRPIQWELDGVTYAWERPISTQQTGFSFISQARADLPDPIGGVYWYGVDNTYTTCYVPLYCCIDDLPESYTTGEMGRFSWDSAWWVFNFVANYANLRYRDMVPDIRAVQHELESNFFALQPAIEQTARALYRTDPDLMRRYLTDYCVTHAERVTQRWKQLAEYLIRKYNDGYVQDRPGRAHESGYPESWLRRVIEQRPAQFRLEPNKTNAPESKLVD